MSTWSVDVFYEDGIELQWGLCSLTVVRDKEDVDLIYASIFLLLGLCGETKRGGIAPT